MKRRRESGEGDSEEGRQAKRSREDVLRESPSDLAIVPSSAVLPAGWLPGQATGTLQEQHPHVRDNDTLFQDEDDGVHGGHHYTVLGQHDYTSVTTFIHEHFPDFIEKDVIFKMMNGRNWSSSKYVGMTPKQISDQWEETRTDASALGTQMHNNIENYYNSEKHETESREWTFFSTFEADHPYLEPWRAEMRVYDKPLRLVGTGDMLYRDRRQPMPTGDEPLHLILADWKRSKEIKEVNPWDKGTTSVTYSMYDCNYYHYTIQLCLYKLLLEKSYNVVIDEMFLLVLHPNQEGYLKKRVYWDDHRMQELVKYRRRTLVSSRLVRFAMRQYEELIDDDDLPLPSGPENAVQDEEMQRVHKLRSVCEGLTSMKSLVEKELSYQAKKLGKSDHPPKYVNTPRDVLSLYTLT